MSASDQTQGKQPTGKLAEFLAAINMSELPAMSTNVQELISLTHSSRSAAYELSRVILKDYSLTNKVLQVVNSAYYAVGRKVSSISRAVTVLGFDAVRDLATGVALFEDFVKAGLDKDEITKLMTRAFVSAVSARDMAVNKDLHVPAEEAFICALLHNLGKTMVCIYAPDVYRKVQQMVGQGKSELAAAREVLGMSYPELGGEIARFWNLADQIAESMEPDPAPPVSSMDAAGMLRCMADFSNRLVDCVCDGRSLAPVLDKYGEMMRTDVEDALGVVEHAVEAAEDISDSLRAGLAKLKFRSRLQAAARQAERGGGEEEGRADGGGQEDPVLEEDTQTRALPVSRDKSVNDYVHDITATLMGPFDLNTFYVQLLEGLYHGIGFDRVVFMIIEIRNRKPALVGRFCLGDIDKSRVSSFRHALDNVKLAMPMALKTGKDLALAGSKASAFPANLQPLVADRQVYLFPVRVDAKPIGLIYLDRLAVRPRLTMAEIKSVRLLRDFAVMAIRKVAGRRKRS